MSAIISRTLLFGFAAILLAACLLYAKAQTLNSEGAEKIEAKPTASNEASVNSSLALQAPESVDRKDGQLGGYEIINEVPLSTTKKEVTLDQAIADAQQLLELGKFEEASQLLTMLYENLADYSSEERIFLSDLYANLLASMELNADAIIVFEDLLALPNVPDAIRLNALKGLGDLYNLENEHESSITAYEAWLSESSNTDSAVHKGLSFAYYKLELYEKALPPAIEHVRLLDPQLESVDRETLMYLNSLAFTTGHWTDAEWITKILIEKFDQPVDWRNLTAIYAKLGDEEARVKAFADAVAAGKIDEAGNLIRL